MMKNAYPLLLLVMAVASKVSSAFVAVNSATDVVCNHRGVVTLQMSTARTHGAGTTRRAWMTKIPALVVAVAPNLPANGYVFVDPDRYGDKELKIATVNKLRQNLRDAMLRDPKLAANFVRIAVQDALTFRAENGEDGPDGTIIRSILAKKDAPAGLDGLRGAAIVLDEIAKKIKRTTEITMADVVTFAGAEAIETAGGPRVVVQLGKLDPKKSATATSTTVASIPNLWGNETTGKEIVSAFVTSGLTQREIALLYGAIGAIEKVASSRLLSNEDEEEEEEENEMGDKTVVIPSSFGAPSEIYGKQLGKFMDASYLASVADDLKRGKRPVASVFSDDTVGSWVLKYAKNKSAFLKDLPEAYGKLMSLGTRYTGGKVGNLLGGNESDI